ncbi:MAG: hypothetical protein K9G60_08985 [Pseudolabrys sp.]|nr:hypothetical protein [Pseudolabrys sp.]
MFSAQQDQTRSRAANERGAIACEKCTTPIYVDRPNNVSIEFSVPCPRCGHRGIYFKRMIVMDAAADRRK